MVSHGVISMTTINPTELCCQSCWVPREPGAKKPVTVEFERNGATVTMASGETFTAKSGESCLRDVVRRQVDALRNSYPDRPQGPARAFGGDLRGVQGKNRQVGASE